jgi:CBS domain-containing protein
MELLELCRSTPITAQPQQPVSEIVRKMQHDNVGAVIIVEGEKIVGLVTDRDIALALGSGKATPDSPASQIMTKQVETIWQDQGIFNATQYLMGHKIRRLPIIDRQERLVGMITADDLLALLGRELLNIAKALEPAIGNRV